MNLSVASSPHFSNPDTSTRRMMLDVVVALLPAVGMSVFLFGWYAVVQICLCVLTCMGSEWLWKRLMRQPASFSEASAALTGLLLALSLPWSAPAYVPVIGSVVAILLGKMVFGGLGMNLFNPAMVGRAFVMLSFAGALGASAYVHPDAAVEVLTQATPLTAVKSGVASMPSFLSLILGNTNGSLGETSALALLAGGIYLCVRRTAAWQIPVGVILGAFVPAMVLFLLKLNPICPTQHLLSGALLLGAFFIATDPVTSPLTARGRLIFGIGVGSLIVILRAFSSYPEGVMFAVLIMNALVPLINRWTIPVPVGGPVPVRK
jgi:electron transport complex protein RnfD